MFGGISSLLQSFRNLAASLNGLAGTVAEANDQLRQRLALDYHPDEIPADWREQRPVAVIPPPAQAGPDDPQADTVAENARDGKTDAPEPIQAARRGGRRKKEPVAVEANGEASNP